MSPYLGKPAECISPKNGAKGKPIQKGETRNPTGYSKKRRELKSLYDYMDEHPGDWDAILSIGAEKAKRGDFNFWSSVMDRLMGKTPDKGNSPTPTTINVVVTSDKVFQILTTKMRVQ